MVHKAVVIHRMDDNNVGDMSDPITVFFKRRSNITKLT